MSIGLSPIQFNNIAVAAPGGAGLTDANQGLTIDGTTVQLGVAAPDLTKVIDVPREIQVSDGGTLAICTPGGDFTGNVFKYDPANGVHIDGRQSGPGGIATRYSFRFDGLSMDTSAAVDNGIHFNQGFPVGVNRANVGVDTDLNLLLDVNNGGVHFRTMGGIESWLGDIGYGYGLNVGFEPGGGSSIVTYSNGSDVRIVTGISDGISPGKFVTWAPSASDVQIVTEISTSTGYMAVAGGNTLSGAMVNIGSGNNAAAQLNFTANGVVANDGDLDYNGTNLIFQNPAGACSLLASAGVSAGPVVMDNTNYVEVIIAGNPVKLLIAV